MPRSRRVFGHLMRSALAAALLLVLLATSAVVAVLARRPPRTNYQEALFQGVTYIRQARSTPRPLLVHVVQIDLTAPGIGFLVTPGDEASTLELFAATTSEFLDRFDVQVAVNGSFFKPFRTKSYTINDYYPHSGNPVDVTGLAISNGQMYSPGDGPYPVACFRGSRAQISTATCPLDTTQALAGSRLLVEDGAPVITTSATAGEPEPRTAIALDAEGKTLWLVVVDGRQPGYSEGVTLPELAEILLQLGANTALNLDGGGSSTLVMAGSHGPRLLNVPMHTRIPLRERPVANHLGVYALPLSKPDEGK